MTIAEQLQARGLQQGLSQGLQRGLQQALEMQLTLKFGTLSAAATARLHSADSDTVTRWLACILSANSAEAVAEL
jgi:flagellar biosynthesis/type III secretory pathway protein FliH